MNIVYKKDSSNIIKAIEPESNDFETTYKIILVQPIWECNPRVTPIGTLQVRNSRTAAPRMVAKPTHGDPAGFNDETIALEYMYNQYETYLKNKQRFSRSIV